MNTREHEMASISVTKECERCDKSTENHTLVSIESIGEVVDYTIPSFPLVTVKLQHVQFRLDNISSLYDGFLKAEGVPQVHAGCFLKVCSGFINAFLVDQAEFDQSIDTAELTLFEDSKVFVIWKWEVLDTIVDQHSITNTDEEDEEAVSMIPETCISDDDEEDDEEEVIHSITFKCIGTSKEERYQETLAQVSLKKRNGIPG